ncbi:ATP-dependent DNA helicase [Peribacillus sp. FSL H8-0477]|uniref:ATP-dependent DNA helicase n=1 Tax=Peribacillus sp. FSL H8-0477 TaxID=2921388 RepID=UPI0030F54736
MSEKFQLSVRSLVEYVYRQGSIQSGFKTNISLSEGTAAHQKLQSLYHEEDRKEVYLQTELTYRDMIFKIDGRCDGLLKANERITIDEIKSTLDWESVTENTYPVHWAQAKCYAFMYAEDTDLQEIQVQLTYVHPKSETIKVFQQTFLKTELAAFMKNLLKGIYPFAKWKSNHGNERRKSIEELKFPFQEYRHGQRKLAGAVFKTIGESKTLFAYAPTGIGKTISTIFPALKAMGENQLTKVIYVTAKTIARESAEDTYAVLVKQGLKAKVVTITAKDKICFHEEETCNPNECPFAQGYYNRLNEALLDVLEHEQLINRPIIEMYARKHTLCPFEFSLDLAYQADAIVCDYNYFFNPRVSLKRFDEKKRSVLLVDEAHNLVDRGREMFSAELIKSTFLSVKRSFISHKALSKAAKEINAWFITIRKQAEQQSWTEDTLPDGLLDLLNHFVEEAERLLITQISLDDSVLLETYFGVQSFLRIAKLYDTHYQTFYRVTKSEVEVKLFCLDPSHALDQMASSFKARVYFSATLHPLPFFTEMLGGKEGDYSITVASPFRKEQNDVYIKPLSTRFHDREKSYRPIIRLIEKMLEGKTGNYLIYFPSYQYMNAVFTEFKAVFSDDCMMQTSGMSEEERAAFLDAFQERDKGLFVGFAVLGGVFAEGINLIGNRLNGVFIIGVGMPQLGEERELMNKHFQRRGKNGFDYAYTYPGMNKVLQAGGRLIRSEQDYGMVILVDDRYLTAKYQGLLPEMWRDFTVL